jgi:hypothetical protein
MIRDIPQGEKDEATPFARSQKSSRSRSGVDDDVPAAAAQAIQKTQVESISENIRKLTFELRVGLFEKAAAPMPATKSDKAYIIGVLKILVAYVNRSWGNLNLWESCQLLPWHQLLELP